MPSIFTKIIARQIPAHIIAEDNQCIAFLDIMPLVHGHTLVVPKKEVDYIFDLDDQTLTALHLFSKRVSKAIKKAVSCNRIGVAVMGLEVPHAHIHLIPISRMSDMNLANPKLKPSAEELGAMKEKIQKEFV